VGKEQNVGDVRVVRPSIEEHVLNIGIAGILNVKSSDRQETQQTFFKRG
jgi:hypothetical protein